MEKNVKHLPFLDGLRGLLAFYVLLVHFVGEDLTGLHPLVQRFHFLFHFGHAAVDFFIVLSGYSLMLSVIASTDKTVRGGFLGYLKRRARRILPAHQAALALSIAVLVIVVAVERPHVVSGRESDLSFVTIASHVFLIHTLVPGQSLTINMALWSIATEWQIYFLFPTLLLPLWRRRGMIPLLVVPFGLGILPLLLLPHGSYLLIGCPWFLGLFALGMIGAVISSSPDESPVRRPVVLLGVLVLAALIYSSAGCLVPATVAGVFGTVCLEDVAMGFVACCLLIHCARHSSLGATDTNKSRPLILQLLESRGAIVLGGFSYSLYATHCAVLTACNCLTGQWELSPMSALMVRLSMGIPLAVATAYCFSLWFEVPFLTKRAPNREPAPAEEANGAVRWGWWGRSSGPTASASTAR